MLKSCVSTLYHCTLSIQQCLRDVIMCKIYMRLSIKCKTVNILEILNIFNNIYFIKF